jgi:hypothetical protein
LSFLISLPAFAEDAAPEKGSTAGMAMDRGMGMPMQGKRMMGCPCAMMGKTQMVATEDGGVIVLVGNKLMKYGADLGLVKEVEVKMPMGSMGGRQCPMMGKMMDAGAAPEAAESQEKTA